MKKSRSSSVTSGRLPVSARFYTNMLERIANSCSAINRQELYDETVGIIREYLLDGMSDRNQSDFHTATTGD